MNDYELVTILNPEITDEDVSDTVERITQYITGRGGEIQNVDQWGRRRLAYPIARQFEGTYVVTHLRLAPANAAELEANLKISEDVIRHLLVRYSPSEQAAAIAAAQRRRPRPISEEASEEGGAAQAIAPAQPATEPEAETVAAEAPAATQPETETTPAETSAATEPEAEAVAAAPEAPATTTTESVAEIPATEPETAPAEPEAEAAPPEEGSAGETPRTRRSRAQTPPEDA